MELRNITNIAMPEGNAVEIKEKATGRLIWSGGKWIPLTGNGSVSFSGVANKTLKTSVFYGKSTRFVQHVPITESPIINPDWAQIDADIQNGKRPFCIGQELIVKKGTQSIPFRVLDYDNIRRAGNPNKPTMLIGMKYVYGSATTYKSLQFDALEALYYTENGLSAGDYFFTVTNQNWYTADNNVSYYFTLTKDIPAGGQLVLNIAYNAAMEGKTIRSYSGPVSTTIIESATLSATPISGATDLGKPDGTYADMNHMHRAIFGSNNYAQSAARQFVLSNAAVKNVWTPQTKFDRPPSWHTSTDSAYAGFRNNLDSIFDSVVKTATVPCRTNTVYECDSLDGTQFVKSQTYTLEDKYFLLSRPEVFNSYDSSTYKDGNIAEFYRGLTTDELKHYDEFNSVRNVWLRSPTPSYAISERVVDTSGAVSNNGANVSYGLLVACII